jgi:hypothetical protein
LAHVTGFLMRLCFSLLLSFDTSAIVKPH